MNRFDKTDVAKSMLKLTIEWNNLDNAKTQAERDLINEKIEALHRDIFENGNAVSIEQVCPGYRTAHADDFKSYIRRLDGMVNAYPSISVAQESSNDELYFLEGIKQGGSEMKKSYAKASLDIIDSVDQYGEYISKQVHKNHGLILKK